MLVRESLYNFKKEQDPISSSGLGVFVKRNFKSLDDLKEFILMNIREICILPDYYDLKRIISDPRSYHILKSDIATDIENYLKNYVMLNNERIHIDELTIRNIFLFIRDKINDI